jgi:hypothetical protein
MQRLIDRHDWFADYGDLIGDCVRDPKPVPEFSWTGAELAFRRFAYNREDNDCGVRALAVACAAPYENAWQALAKAGRVPEQPSFPAQMMAAANELRCLMVRTTCAAKTLLTVERELAETHGGFIVTTSNHAAGIWNGELIDHARGRLWRVDGIYRVEPLRDTLHEIWDQQNRLRSET